MSPSPHLLTIQSKIKWAKQHIVNLEVAIRTFLETNPYKFLAKRDTETRKPIYYISSVEDAPVDISYIATDAISNLVSVLDYLAYGLFLKDTGGIREGRHVYFPIVGAVADATEYEAKRQRKVEGMSEATINALDTIEPYKGGKGHDLWILNELNNLSKHRDLITVGAIFNSMDIGTFGFRMLEKMVGMPIPSIPLFVKPADHLCPLEIGDELFVDTPDAEIYEDMKFTFDVAFNEPQITHAEPLINTVHQFANVVSNIVDRFAGRL